MDNSPLPVPATPLPPWTAAELPAPLPFGLRSFFHVIGPGAILLATSIGSGEWLIGPASAVKYGTGILGIVTVSVLFQVLFNIETMRYTVATGEPIFTGFMRLGRRPRTWGFLYILFGFLQLGWPAFAATSASTLFAAVNGRLPVDSDASAVLAYGILTFLLCFAILASGRTVERTLELASWVMMMLVFVFLILVNIAFVPATVWWRTLQGFFFLGGIPRNLDWRLIGAFAAYAGAGGIVNLMLSNWARDKGFGMGAIVGSISSAAGGKTIPLSPGGKIFPVDSRNIRHWRTWMLYLQVEQAAVWGFFCVFGMFLTVNLAVNITPPGTDLTGLAAGAYQAEYLARRVTSSMWLLTLLNGFWILFSTQLVTMDALVRLGTDVLWTVSPGLRAFCNEDVRKVYYGLLLSFALWGSFALTLAPPVTLVLIGANIAGFILMFSAIHIIVVNRRLLPITLRPSLFREVLMVLISLFFGFFVVMNLTH